MIPTLCIIINTPLDCIDKKVQERQYCPGSGTQCHGRRRRDARSSVLALARQSESYNENSPMSGFVTFHYRYPLFATIFPSTPAGCSVILCSVGELGERN